MSSFPLTLTSIQFHLLSAEARAEILRILVPAAAPAPVEHCLLHPPPSEDGAPPPLGYSMNSRGEYSTFAPPCRCPAPALGPAHNYSAWERVYAAAERLEAALGAAVVGNSNELEHAIERNAEYLEVDSELVARARARLAALRIEEAAPAATPEAAPAAAPEAARAAAVAAPPPLALAVSSLLAPAMATPPGSPMLSPVPLARCGPSGPDPFTEEREALRARAAAGCPCPVNQHGCMYFSASEWRFCQMCEWETGVAQGRAAGTLNALGVAYTVRTEESTRGQDIALSRSELDDVLVRARSYSPGVTDTEWDGLRNSVGAGLGNLYLTRSDLHNLLMRHGAPSDILTDELWAELQAAYQ